MLAGSISRNWNTRLINGDIGAPNWKSTSLCFAQKRKEWRKNDTDRSKNGELGTCQEAAEAQGASRDSLQPLKGSWTSNRESGPEAVIFSERDLVQIKRTGARIGKLLLIFYKCCVIRFKISSRVIKERISKRRQVKGLPNLKQC